MPRLAAALADAAAHDALAELLDLRCGVASTHGSATAGAAPRGLPVRRSVVDAVLLLRRGASSGGIHLSGAYDASEHGYRYKFFRASTCERLLRSLAAMLGAGLLPAAALRRRTALSCAIGAWRRLVARERAAYVRRAERSVLRAQERLRRARHLAADCFLAWSQYATTMRCRRHFVSRASWLMGKVLRRTLHGKLWQAFRKWQVVAAEMTRRAERRAGFHRLLLLCAGRAVDRSLVVAFRRWKGEAACRRSLWLRLVGAKARRCRRHAVEDAFRALQRERCRLARDDELARQRRLRQLEAQRMRELLEKLVAWAERAGLSALQTAFWRWRASQQIEERLGAGIQLRMPKPRDAEWGSRRPCRCVRCLRKYGHIGARPSRHQDEMACSQSNCSVREHLGGRIYELGVALRRGKL